MSTLQEAKEIRGLTNILLKMYGTQRWSWKKHKKEVEMKIQKDYTIQTCWKRKTTRLIYINCMTQSLYSNLLVFHFHCVSVGQCPCVLVLNRSSTFCSSIPNTINFYKNYSGSNKMLCPLSYHLVAYVRRLKFSLYDNPMQIDKVINGKQDAAV